MAMTIRRFSGRSQKTVGRRAAIESSGINRSAEEPSSPGTGKKNSPKLLRTFRRKARKLFLRAGQALVGKLASSKSKPGPITDREADKLSKGSKEAPVSQAAPHKSSSEASPSEKPQRLVRKAKETPRDRHGAQHFVPAHRPSAKTHYPRRPQKNSPQSLPAGWTSESGTTAGAAGSQGETDKRPGPQIADAVQPTHEQPLALSPKTDEQSAIQEQSKSLIHVELIGPCDGTASPASEPATTLETQSDLLPPPFIQSVDDMASANPAGIAEVTQHGPAFSISDQPALETIRTIERVVQPQVETGRDHEPLPVQDGAPASTHKIGSQGDIEARSQTDGLGALPAEPQQPTKTKTLVIDDDSTLGDLLKMLLESFGYHCVTAENGKAAQEVLQTYRPDLILLDLFMPVMDGLVFIHWLRETAHDSTPVLVFSSVDDRSVAEEALRAGANSFIGKPLQVQGIVQEMKRLVPF